MIPIVSIVGRSGSGKTTLLEKVVAELTRKGYKVGTVKHDVHGFDIDKEGKDSWRHKKAGAKTVVISSPTKLAMVRDVDAELALDRIRFNLLEDVDIIITEGYKKAMNPKIEVIRKSQATKPICSKNEQLIAIAADTEVDIDLPCFNINDAEGISNFIEELFLKKTKVERNVFLMVNGKRVPLKPFIRDFLSDSIKGMVSSLRGCKNPKKIEIKID
ncbi:MAG: molybdopterin-guanine dinucleotide biosynthesis protein B [Deltaproteobacteria bacterium]|nr:molybdopterin-guanine dinucleotide biosynthesis protein B [Deltaproteobacteria bacterium]